MNEATEPPEFDTTPAGLDRLADTVAAEFECGPAGRDVIRAKLAEFENVVLHPVTGKPVRMVEHELSDDGDWKRVTFEPFLRVVS